MKERQRIMKTFSWFKSVVSAAVFLFFIVPAKTRADDYKWLKTTKYENIFVYTDFSECDSIADKLNETVKRTLLHADIKPTISNSLVFQTSSKGKQSTQELIDSELIAGNKIILYIYGKCIEYNSVYIYQFDINFAVVNNKYSQALLYSSPQHSVLGADTLRGIDRVFRRLMEDALEDYLSANKANTK